MTVMRFILDGVDRVSDVLNDVGDGAVRLHRRMEGASKGSSDALDQIKKSAISLAPAVIPAAAALAPLVAHTAAAGVAAGAYAVALGPQIVAIGEASQAQKKFDDAVEKSGARSKEAVQAQEEYVRSVAKLPPATREAAVALSILKDDYKDWSNSLAGDTMGPFTKGLAIAGALLPKLSPLVKGTSTELDRMMTIVGGGMASPGFDRLVGKFSGFATGTLRSVNDGVISFLRSLDSGKVGGGLSEFMEYARANGPLLGSVLQHIGEALVNLLKAGGDVGVGMLQAVDVLARLASAVPPGVITVLLQLAVAMRVAKLAALGFVGARAAVAAFGGQLVAMRAAAGGAAGGMASFTAAFGAMSRGVKVAVAGTGVGLLLVLMGSLMEMGKRSPADLDRMTTSLGKFGRTGHMTGEAARVVGEDFREFDEALRGMARPSGLDQVQQSITSFFGMDSTPVKRWKGVLDDLDKSLANMVTSGNADMAAKSFDALAARAKSQGMTTAELRKQLGDYRAALENKRFEEQLAAASMGLFGAQAQAVQTKLDGQKRSADGLRQSLQALNDVNRQGLGGMIGFEAAIDAAAEAAKKNAGALTMTGGQLNLNSEKARTAATALTDLAARTDEAASSARESGASWSTVNGIYARGRAQLMSSAQAMGLTRAQAAALAAQILRTPDKTARLRGNMEDLQAKLAHARNQLARVPDSRRAAIRARIDQLEAAIRQAKADLGSVRDKSVTITTNYRVTGHPAGHSGQGGFPKFAKGGRPEAGWALVGEEGPELVRFRGGEQVYDHRTSMRMAGAGMDAGRGLSAGLVGSVSGVEGSARIMASAVVAGVRAELQIASPSKRMKALAVDTAKGMIVGLTGEKSKIKAVAADLVKDIWAAWSGSKSTKDSRLVAMVNRDTARLMKLADQRTALAKRIADAKAYANTLADNARSSAGLQQLGLGEDVSGEGIRVGLIGKLARLQQFAKKIAELGRRGLHKGLLRQILDMGPEAGFEYANALASADRFTFSQINTAQGQIDKAASGMALTGADAMYDAGRQAGRGFLTGLAAQQKDIQNLMLSIAKGMQSAIRKALGIRSPSRVMAVEGRYATQGLGVGLIEGIPFLDRALGAVTGRVAAARPVLGRPAAAAAGTAASQVSIQVDVHGAIDPVATAREIQRMLLNLKRTQGVNIALGVG